MAENKRRQYNVLVGDGLGTEWMSMKTYCEKLHEKGGPKSYQVGRARVLSGVLEKKNEKLTGVALVREPKLKKGTRRYDLYFQTKTCP
jgi:hypothetical protein